MRTKLDEIQRKIQAQPFNKELHKEEAQLRPDYIEVLPHSTSLIKQQGKCKWLAMWDQCLKLLFFYVQSRRLMTFVNRLDTNNGYVEG